MRFAMIVASGDAISSLWGRLPENSFLALSFRSIQRAQFSRPNRIRRAHDGRSLTYVAYEGARAIMRLPTANMAYSEQTAIVIA